MNHQDAIEMNFWQKCHLMMQNTDVLSLSNYIFYVENCTILSVKLALETHNL